MLTSGGMKWGMLRVIAYEKACKLTDSGQIIIIPKPELRGFGGDGTLTKPPFGVTNRREKSL